MEKHLPRMTMRKNNTSYSMRKNKITKEAYREGLKSIGKMVGFATVFADITEEASI